MLFVNKNDYKPFLGHMHVPPTETVQNYAFCFFFLLVNMYCNRSNSNLSPLYFVKSLKNVM